jgi:trk system potassium uptake protein TrkA
MARRQRFLVLGAGSLGRSLATRLARDGGEVTLVDDEAGRLEGLAEVADLRPVHGSATSLRVLRQAGAADADVVLALTGSDSANALVCGLAKRLGARTAIARVRDPELAAAAAEVGLASIGIDQAISPEGLAVEALIRIALSPGCIDALDLADGRVALRAVVVARGAPLAGRTVEEARRLVPGGWLVAAVGGADGWRIPGPGAVLAAGEPAYICAPAGELAALVPHLDPAARAPRRVVVVGAGAIGDGVARALASAGLRVQLLESDAAEAERAALDLAEAGVEVLGGVLADAGLAERLRIGAADVLLATASEDQDNLMAALLARARGVARVVAVAHHEPTARLMASLDLDAVVSPRRLAAAVVQRAVRGRSVAQLSRLSDEHLEFVDLTVPEGARAVGRTLRHLGLPRGCLVLARAAADGAVAVPGPDTAFAAGDRVVVACASEHDAAVARAFA